MNTASLTILATALVATTAFTAPASAGVKPNPAAHTKAAVTHSVVNRVLGQRPTIGSHSTGQHKTVVNRVLGQRQNVSHGKPTIVSTPHPGHVPKTSPIHNPQTNPVNHYCPSWGCGKAPIHPGHPVIVIKGPGYGRPIHENRYYNSYPTYVYGAYGAYRRPVVVGYDAPRPAYVQQPGYAAVATAPSYAAPRPPAVQACVGSWAGEIMLPKKPGRWSMAGLGVNVEVADDGSVVLDCARTNADQLAQISSTPNACVAQWSGALRIGNDQPGMVPLKGGSARITDDHRIVLSCGG